MKVCYLLIILILLCGCHTPTPDPVKPAESVIVRAGQMYALVNGQEWRTCGPVTAPKTFAQLFVAEYFDMVGAGLCSNTEIYFKIINLQGEGTYFLGDTSSNYALYWGHNKYYTDATHTGEITIEQIDSMTNQVEKLPYRVSGTFSFTAINEANSDTVFVTKGYFNKIDVYVF